jgi:hexokinase
MLRQAADEGELSEGMTTYVREHDFNFVDLNHFAAGQNLTLFPTTLEEQNRIRQWILAIVERAACFAAVNIAAAALASAQARGKTHGTILVNADGSTFWKTSCIPFAEKIQTETKRLLQPYGFDLYCLQIEDSPLIGAALAATQI